MYDMLSWMETFIEIHPKTKGARLYSLLPFSHSFVPSHVTINVTTLHDLFCRIYHDPVVKAFVNNELELTCKTTKDQRAWLLHRDTFLRKVFKVTEVETSTRTFTHPVTTYGYGASILLRREVPAAAVDDPTSPPKKRRTTWGIPIEDSPDDVEKYAFDLAREKLPGEILPRYRDGD